MLKDQITLALKDMFKHAINKTRETYIEHGFVICKDEEGNLTPSDMCIGDKCSVHVKGRCRYKVEGFFHVHPGEFIIPTHTDLLNGVLSKCRHESEGTMCVGASETDKIECWTLKKLTQSQCKKAEKDKIHKNPDLDVYPRMWLQKLYKFDEIDLKGD